MVKEREGMILLIAIVFVFSFIIPSSVRAQDKTNKSLVYSYTICPEYTYEKSYVYLIEPLDLPYYYDSTEKIVDLQQGIDKGTPQPEPPMCPLLYGYVLLSPQPEPPDLPYCYYVEVDGMIIDLQQGMVMTTPLPLPRTYPLGNSCTKLSPPQPVPYYK